MYPCRIKNINKNIFLYIGGSKYSIADEKIQLKSEN